MKKIFEIISILAIFVNCAGTPEKLSANDNQDNMVFSDNGSVSFQNNEYLLVGILVEDLKKTLEIWGIPDNQGFPKFSTITQVKRNEPISVFLAYATKKNEINLTYNFKTLRPDGTFSNNAYQGLEIANGSSPDDLIYKSKQLPTIIFDETDRFGKYQFHITVFDNNNLITNFILEFNLIE
jgi:hypothetical protein